MFSPALIAQAKKFVALCKKEKVTFCAAESCTGGLISSLITEISGSSAVVDRGFVTYSNQAKISMLGVGKVLIARHGAVSAEVAGAMARGARKNSNATLSVGVTGIAGPTGGTRSKPVGLAYIAASYGRASKVEEFHFTGTRAEVRLQAVAKAIKLASEMLAR